MRRVFRVSRFFLTISLTVRNQRAHQLCSDVPRRRCCLTANAGDLCEGSRHDQLHYECGDELWMPRIERTPRWCTPALRAIARCQVTLVLLIFVASTYQAISSPSKRQISD